MRIAMVSPYSWSCPGGVTRHVEALAEQLRSEGHTVRVLAPFDPIGRLASLSHRGAQPQRVSPPDYLVALGRTVGLRANGAVSNLSITPGGLTTTLEELRTGSYDVVHVHEPVAPTIGWVATDRAPLPLVGTFHAYSEKPLPNAIANMLGARRVLGQLNVRIAVSEAAAWTGRHWFGGEYRVIPNGVRVDPLGARRATAQRLDDRLCILFVGQPVERKGLPVLLRAFEALRAEIPTELVLIGPSLDEVGPTIRDQRGVRALGKLDDEAKRRELELADVLCAPSLGGESFGMVLTEAFAAGTPVVASDIVGYREVVRDGRDGMLVPAGDAQAFAGALRYLWTHANRRAEMGRAAAVWVERFAWPRIAAQVLEAYEEAITTRHLAGIRPHGVGRHVGAAIGLTARFPSGGHPAFGSAK
jgi:phosphatidyl-myo-inositol alpha-mannosyltransferase